MTRVALLLSLAACTSQPPVQSQEAIFAVGSDQDPVVQMALTTLPNMTMQITFTNNTGYDFSEGLIRIGDKLFANNTSASTALKAFATATATTKGNPLVFADNLDLVMGTNGFYTPAVPAGKSVTVVFSFPNTTNFKLSWAAYIVGSDDDFIGIEEVGSDLTSAAVRGYDIDGGSKSRIGEGNTTIGREPRVDGRIVDLSSCSTTMGQDALVLNQTFSQSKWNHSWPWTIGFDGDFNGDWYTDGVTARMIDANAALPTITGFAKFLYICPQAGAKLHVSADIATLYTQQDSDTTIVVYFFNASNQYISHVENIPLHGKQQPRKHSLFDAVIPAGTRKIAIVPMGYFASGEKDSAHYYNLRADYELASSYSTTSLATDSFTSYDATNQPSGWTDFGGDWFAHPQNKHLTLWNPNFPGSDNAAALPMNAAITKSFPLGTVTGTTKLSVRAFASTTFTNPESFVQLRVKFNNAAATTYLSDALRNTAWTNLDLRRIAVPTGATQAEVAVIGVLQTGERSSFYVDDLNVWKVQ